MKSLLMKLVPGIVATLAAMAFGAVCLVRAQQPAAAVTQIQQVQALPAPAPEQYMVCGACGARILAPQAVLVASPFYPVEPRQGYGYGAQPVNVVRGPNGYYLDDCCDDSGRGRIRPAPVFSLTDYGRADPRLIRRNGHNDHDRRFH